MIETLKRAKRLVFSIILVIFLFLGGLFSLNFFIIQKLISKFNSFEEHRQKKLLKTYLENIEKDLLFSNNFLEKNLSLPKNLNILYAVIDLKHLKYIKLKDNYQIIDYEDILFLKDLNQSLCFFKNKNKKIFYVCANKKYKKLIYSAYPLSPLEAQNKYDLYFNFLDSIAYIDNKKNILFFVPLKDYKGKIVSFLFVYYPPCILNLTKTIFNLSITYASLVLAFFVIFLIPFYIFIKKQIKQRFLLLTDILKGVLCSSSGYNFKLPEEILDFPSDEKEFLYKLKDLTFSLSEKMFKDPLTKAYNRLYFSSRLKEEIERAKRYNHPLSLILLDIDFFKKINDTYGHDVGDLVLKTISQIILENIRKSDLFARIGGEEFAILLPDTSKDKAILVAEKLRETIEKTPIILPNGKQIKVTISLGVTSLKKDDDESSFIKRADEALYDAKKSGRNIVKVR